MDEKLENIKKINVPILVLIIVIIDQITKFGIVSKIYESSIVIIDNVLKFTYLENRGAAFGVGQDSTLTFIITNIIVLGIIIRFMIQQKNRIDKKTTVAFSLILAGGTSNLIDRIFRGFVVDFIDINQLFSFPIFNIADACIVIGWILIVLFLTIYTANFKKETKR